jgi:hypothetical protein
MRLAAALPLSLVVVLLLAACVNDPAAAPPAAPSTPIASVTTAPPEQVPGDKPTAPSHEPKERHVPADMALARRAVANPSDLLLPWHAVQLPQGRGRPCPGVDPDLSRLTITGRAQSNLLNENGLSAIYSSVKVFANDGQADAYFEAHYTDAFKRCFEHDSLALFKQTGAQRVRLATARMGSEPPVANDTRIIELEYELMTDQGRIFLGTQLVAFRTRRAIGQNIYVNLADGQLVVAQHVAVRLRAG